MNRSVIPNQTRLNGFKADFLLRGAGFVLALPPRPEPSPPQADTVELTA